MTNDISLWMYFANAGFAVKLVMLLLMVASVASWTIIFQRGMVLRQARLALAEFETAFWSGSELSKLYTEINTRRSQVEGIAAIFQAGFREFTRLRKQQGVPPAMILEGAQRAMRIAYSRESDRLEQHLSFLATVGSTSPYVGLFGTVWGIMLSLHALGSVSQATIGMVAPGISEALVATAMGLFAAIPAVIAYNRYANDVERILNQYDTFQEELFSILHRHAHGTSGTML